VHDFVNMVGHPPEPRMMTERCFVGAVLALPAEGAASGAPTFGTPRGGMSSYPISATAFMKRSI
jgi:hypothetical protein